MPFYEGGAGDEGDIVEVEDLCAGRKESERDVRKKSRGHERENLEGKFEFGLEAGSVGACWIEAGRRALRFLETVADSRQPWRARLTGRLSHRMPASFDPALRCGHERLNAPHNHQKICTVTLHVMGWTSVLLRAFAG